MRRITEPYFARNLSIEELRELARSASADPLKSFIEACRKELHPMRVAADRMRLECRNFFDAAEPHGGR